MEEKKDWDFWRIIGVVALFIAGGNLLLLAHIAKELLPTVLLTAAGVFLFCSAAYDIKTGRVFSRRRKLRGETLSSIGGLKDVFSSDGRGLAKIISTSKKSIKTLGSPLAFACREFLSLLGGSNSGEKVLSQRQRKIRFEDILARPVEEVKEKVESESVDLWALLEAEKRNRNREELIAWLEEKVKSGRSEVRE